MGLGMVRAAQPGSDRVSRTRPRRRGAARKCATPGCAEDAVGGRFCATHQAVLDRVRAELEEESASGKAQEDMLRKSTRGMKKARWEIERDAAAEEAEAVAEALGDRP